MAGTGARDGDTGRAGAGSPRARRDDHGALEPPPLGGWEPVLDVSVVVPAPEQAGLDLALASLAAQSYPPHLVEVVVVDGGDGPPLRLPGVRPERTRIVAAPPGGHGPEHALRAGAAAATGAVVLRADGDTGVGAAHVEAQMRWHHLLDHLVVLGGAPSPRAEDPDGGGPRGSDAVERPDPGAPDRLGSAGHRARHPFAGTAWSVRRALLTACGGTDTDTAPGGDALLGYRLAQRGAVFVPEPAASRSPAGPRARDGSAGEDRYAGLFLDHRVPTRRARRASRRQWRVPFADVVVEAAGAGWEAVSATVEPLLAGDPADVRITLVGEWSRAGEGRHAVLDDPDADLRLVRESFRCESRVVFAQEAPRADPDVPFRLLLAAGLAPRAGAVRALTDEADASGAGLVLVRGADDRPVLRLERTAAFARARLLGAADRDLDAAVAALWGVREVDPDAVLAGLPGGEEPPADWRQRMRRAARSADRDRAAADRWERRIRVLVRGRRVGLLLARPFWERRAHRSPREAGRPV